MINYLQFTSGIPERGIDEFIGYHEIIDNKAHVFLPANLDIYSSVHHLNTLERNRSICSQFINCHLYKIGHDFDEYIVETAYVGESLESYNINLYKSAYFELSNNLVSFFEPPWTYTNSLFDNSSKGLVFKSPEERNRIIVIDENITFILKTGYSQSYSNIRYKARASVQFAIECNAPVQREILFDIIQSVADYYALFCQKPIEIVKIQFVNSQNITIEYYGDKISISKQSGYFGNTLIEEMDIKDHLNQLPRWIANYPKTKIAMNLIRDASKVSEEQLKFICYFRGLEIFHKENFKNSSKADEIFFKGLDDFATKEGLSSISISNQDSKKIYLIHRILDLIRSVYDYTKKDVLLFGSFTGLDRAQQLVDTRNYFIHFSDSKKKNVVNYDQLRIVNEQLLLLFRVILMKHFEFERQTIKGVIGAIRRRLF
jgi:hypothetical protein